MLIYQRSSLLKSRSQTVVNTVNCVGVMGKGIAAEFKKRYPDMFAKYREICRRGELEPGLLWLWHGPDQWVLNFPTKKHWRHPSKLGWIEDGLEKFVATFAAYGIREISFPRLGCGNGGLDWADVQPLMERYLSSLPIRVHIHDYEVQMGAPEHLESELFGPSRNYINTFSTFVEKIESHLNRRESFHNFAGREIYAKIIHDPSPYLVITEEGSETIIDEEGLFATWVAALGGFITMDKLVWQAGNAADNLLTILLTLPDAQSFEIQRPTATFAERAVDLRSGTSPAIAG